MLNSKLTESICDFCTKWGLERKPLCGIKQENEKGKNRQENYRFSFVLVGRHNVDEGGPGKSLRGRA